MEFNRRGKWAIFLRARGKKDILFSGRTYKRMWGTGKGSVACRSRVPFVKGVPPILLGRKEAQAPVRGKEGGGKEGILRKRGWFVFAVARWAQTPLCLPMSGDIRKRKEKIILVGKRDFYLSIESQCLPQVIKTLFFLYWRTREKGKACER